MSARRRLSRRPLPWRTLLRWNLPCRKSSFAWRSRLAWICVDLRSGKYFCGPRPVCAGVSRLAFPAVSGSFEAKTSVRSVAHLPNRLSEKTFALARVRSRPPQPTHHATAIPHLALVPVGFTRLTCGNAPQPFRDNVNNPDTRGYNSGECGYAIRRRAARHGRRTCTPNERRGVYGT